MSIIPSLGTFTSSKLVVNQNITSVTMKTVAATLLCIVALAASAQAIRTDELISSILSQQEEVQDAVRSTMGLFQSEDVPVSKEGKGPPAYALIKYIVVPSKAKAFIKVIDEAKKAAEQYEGYKAYYLSKTVDDNISFISWAAWESVGDLVHYLKSEDAEKVIKFTVDEDIVTLITGVKPIV